MTEYVAHPHVQEIVHVDLVNKTYHDIRRQGAIGCANYPKVTYEEIIGDDVKGGIAKDKEKIGFSFSDCIECYSHKTIERNDQAI